MNYWVFDEQGNWFLRNERGHFASRTYPTFDALLEAVASSSVEDAESEDAGE
jgi:hypothetical protein